MSKPDDDVFDWIDGMSEQEARDQLRKEIAEMREEERKIMEGDGSPVPRSVMLSDEFCTDAQMRQHLDAITKNAGGQEIDITVTSKYLRSLLDRIAAQHVLPPELIGEPTTTRSISDSFERKRMRS